MSSKYASNFTIHQKQLSKDVLRKECFENLAKLPEISLGYNVEPVFILMKPLLY